MDTDCLNDQEQTGIRPPGIIDIPREKNATVILYPPANCKNQIGFFPLSHLI